MTDFQNTPLDPIETPANPIDGFVFQPAGSDVWQVLQKINGQYQRIDDAAARPEGKVAE
ncbi:hypothetical protein ACE102_17520 [Bradyrhizobium sp. vgs-9]|uniref:hypothetical protein n=1 Tax=Bradyrhizobium sp. vgs-9 TaxID=208389 RepID=UPI0035D492B3